MKGIVLEIKNKEAAILSDDGAVSKVKNKNYEIGQVIVLKEKKKLKSKLIASVAGLAAAMAFFATGTFAYYTPTSYVSLDVNPSIEYSVNMFDRVLVVKAVNDDGKDIVINLDVEHKKITEAVEKTIDKLMEAGYITEDENSGVVIAVSNPKEDKAEGLAKKIEKETKKHLDEEGEAAKLEVEAVGKARVEEARTLGVTPGKLNLVQKLKASAADPDEIVIEEWLNKSVKEINKTIKANREQLKNSDEDDKKTNDEKLNKSEPSNEDKAKFTNPNKPVKEDKPVKEKDAKADEDKIDKGAAATIEDEDDDSDEVAVTDEHEKEDNSKGAGNADKEKHEKSNNGKSENSKK